MGFYYHLRQMENNIESKYLIKLIEHFSLNTEESKELMDLFLSGEFNPITAAAILSIISFKGEQPEELAGFSLSLTGQMKKFNSAYTDLLDIVGTGGDNKKAFNISTVASLMLSCLGIKVAKQIRFSASSKCGSGDLLKAYGINVDASYDQKKLCLEEENFVFINSTEYYPVIDKIKKIEAELGFPTILNLLPVLCHPAMVNKIIIGTPDRIKASLMARCLELIGIQKAYVLWNEAGYDEIVPIGNTRVIVVEKNKEKRELTLTANDFAISGNYKVGTVIKGGTLEINKEMLEEVDSFSYGIALDTIIMNVSLALRLGGQIEHLREGAELIKSKFKKGMLLDKIQKISRISNSI